MAELIRRRLESPREGMIEDKLEALTATAGAWRDRDFTGKEYVEQIRGPGLGKKLQLLGL